MNVTTKRWMVLLAAMSFLTGSAFAADTAASAMPTLKIGDPAPAFQPSQWLQGAPFTQFRPGKTYLIDFWATWCGRTSIPRVNDLATKYKDKGLVVVGVNSFEKNEAGVAPYIKKMGDKMTYPIVLDTKAAGSQGVMAESWVIAAGRDTIPCAFLIDAKGMIAWIGHPMELKTDLLEKVLDGTYDLKDASAKYAERLKAIEQRKKDMAPAEAKMAEMDKAIRAKKWDEAAADLSEAEKLVPENRRGAVSVQMEMARFSIFIGSGNYTKACAWAEKVGAANNNNPRVQNFLAWTLATQKGVKVNLDIAQRLANRAVELTKTNNAETLDTQAYILFLKGQQDDAVVAQTKAVALAPAAQKQALQTRLESYKKGQLPASD